MENLRAEYGTITKALIEEAKATYEYDNLRSQCNGRLQKCICEIYKREYAEHFRNYGNTMYIMRSYLYIRRAR